MKGSQKSNRKLVYIVVALSLTMLSLVGALVGVLAVTQIGINNSWNIRFNTDGHVSARVKMSYIVGGNTYIPPVYASNGGQYEQNEDGYIFVDTTTEVEEGIASPTGIELTAENPTLTVIFEVLDTTGIGTVNGGYYYGVDVGIEVLSNNNALDCFDIQYWEKGARRNDQPIETDAEGYSRYDTKSDVLTAVSEENWYYDDSVFWKIVFVVKDHNSEINNAAVDVAINISSRLV